MEKKQKDANQGTWSNIKSDTKNKRRLKDALEIDELLLVLAEKLKKMLQ